MEALQRKLPDLLPILALLVLAACGGGSSPSAPSPPPAMYSVGGYVAGLTGSGLTLSYNGGTAVAVSRNGAFTSATSVTIGTAYSVTIVGQPTNPAQICAVSNGSGAMATANVSSISVSCPQSIGTRAYVATGGSITSIVGQSSVPGSISEYTIDPSTGALSLVSGSTVTTGPNVTSFQFVPHSSFAWALSLGDDQAVDQNYFSSIFAYTADSSTGLLTSNSGNPFFTLDGTSNTSAACGISGQGTTQAVTFSPGGTFGYAYNTPELAAGNGGIQIFTIDSATGAPAALSSVTGGCGGPVTIDPSGQFVYFETTISGNGDQEGLSANTIDSTTGVLTPIAGSPWMIGVGAVGPVTTDPFGRFV
jgi:hypothetical protein